MPNNCFDLWRSAIDSAKRARLSMHEDHCRTQKKDHVAEPH
jgi:hypothetical protein